MLIMQLLTGTATAATFTASPTLVPPSIQY
jgi:hypothetical protein